MATGTKKADTKAAVRNGKAVVAEKAKTTEADGFVENTKTQKTAKAAAPKTVKPAKRTIYTTASMPKRLSVRIARCICRGGSMTKRSSSRARTRYFSRSQVPDTREFSWLRLFA